MSAIRTGISEDNDPTDKGHSWAWKVSDVTDVMYRHMREHRPLALSEGIVRLKDAGLGNEEIERLLRPQTVSIVRWLDGMMRNTLYIHVSIITICEMLELGIRWSQLIELINARKNEFMVNLLTRVKKASTEHLDLDLVEKDLRALHEAGIDWPELDVISDSVNRELDRRDQGITEGNWYTRREQELMVYRDLLDDVERTGAIAYFDRMLIDMVERGQTIRDWPELADGIEVLHHTVVKTMLQAIRDSGRRHYGYILQMVMLMKKAGVDWPELGVMERSLRRDDAMDESQLVSEGVDLRQYVRNDGGTYFINIPVNQTWNTSGKGLWSTAAKPVRVLSIKQDVEPGDHGWLSDLGVHFDTETWDVETDGLIYTDPLFKKQLHQFLLKMGVPAEIVDDIGYSEQGMQGEEWVSFDANEFGEYVIDQFIIGDAATIEDRKRELVIYLLRLIKDGNITRPMAVIEKLRELGADWPEFDAMERSLRAQGQIKESPEDNLEQGRQAVLSILRRTMQDHRGIYYVMYHMDDWGLKLQDWPEIAQLVDDHKDEIVRGLLKPLSDPHVKTSEALESAEFLISRMRRIGVDWPELGIIQRSIDAEQDRSK